MICDGKSQESPCKAIFGKEKRDYEKLSIGHKISNPSPVEYDVQVNFIKPNQKSLAIIKEPYVDSRDFLDR